MFGRVRSYYKPNPNAENFKKVVAHIKRQGANAPIQGTSADIIKKAMVNLYYDLKTYGYRADIINQVHDEVVLLAHKSHSKDIKEVVEESMIQSAREVITSVPIEAEAKILDSWKK
jgi:DNA polymerase-1